MARRRPVRSASASTWSADGTDGGRSGQNGRSSYNGRMTTLTIRNRRLSAFAATEAKNEFGHLLETALRSGAVAITRHDTVKAVLLSVEEYEALLPQTGKIETLTGEFDALLTQMQTPVARRAAWKAFRASPKELGAAAVAAARAKKKKRG